jgi:hypothetical protein
MTCFIAVPAEVVPLLYSGVELVVWGLDGELEQAFPTRSENHTWYAGPLGRLDRACEFLRVLDWPASGPVEATVEIDGWRDLLLLGFEEELRAQTAHRDDSESDKKEDADESGLTLRDRAMRDIAIIEGFLARLPEIEAEGEVARPITDQRMAQRAIVLQVLRDDHDERWSRAELEAELHDVEPQAVTDALEHLREEGVIHLSGDLVWASRCARRLGELGVVSI